MTDARTWLAHPRHHMYTDQARMADALLAVLDECDRLDSEDDDYYPTIWYDALAHAADRIHAAIDKALGVTDE